MWVEIQTGSLTAADREAGKALHEGAPGRGSDGRGGDVKLVGWWISDHIQSHPTPTPTPTPSARPTAPAHQGSDTRRIPTLRLRGIAATAAATPLPGPLKLPLLPPPPPA
jgi:hypothetical protein